MKDKSPSFSAPRKQLNELTYTPALTKNSHNVFKQHSTTLPTHLVTKTQQKSLNDGHEPFIRSMQQLKPPTDTIPETSHSSSSIQQKNGKPLPAYPQITHHHQKMPKTSSHSSGMTYIPLKYKPMTTHETFSTV